MTAVNTMVLQILHAVTAGQYHLSSVVMCCKKVCESALGKVVSTDTGIKKSV